MGKFEQGFALLIGVDENNVSAWSLPSVAKDIAALEQVLTHPDRCAYLPEHIKVLSGKSATRQGILEGLDWLQQQLCADTSGDATAIILYSGHGWRDATMLPAAYYLIPYDVRQDNLRSRALRAEDFADAVRALTPRRLLVILDCCHAGGMDIRDAQPGAAFLDAPLPPEQLIGKERTIGYADGPRSLETLAQGHGRAVLSSSQGDQPSYNRRDGKMGIFTYHLIEALTGHAQPQAGASEVLVSDVMSHVWRCVPQSAQADWGKMQQPDYQVSGNFPVALLLGGRGVAEGQVAPDPLKAPGRPSSVNTGGGEFTGRDKIIHGDEVRGNKVTGDSIKVGNISGSGSAIAIGRNAHVTVTTGFSGADLDLVFAPILLALRDVPPIKREETAEKVAALRAETARGAQADDKKMAKLLDGLNDFAPGLTTALTSAFNTPLLVGIIGPVTSFVLEKFRLPK